MRLHSFIATLTVLSTCLVTAHRAEAQPTGLNYTIHVATGANKFCMDAKDNRQNEGTEIFVWRCHGRENQRWTVTKDQDGTATLIGTGGFCLDVRGQTATANGTPVQLWRCHFQKNQRFSLGPDFRIREVESHKCLQALKPQDGSPVVLDTCHNNETEVWHFEQ